MGIDGVGATGAVVAVVDDMGGDGMQCSDHPYRNNSSPGGICAFCLQEKLGKLVSSSSSSFIRSSTASSSSPSFRSDLLQQQQQLPTLRLTPCSIADVGTGVGLRQRHEGSGGGYGSSSSSSNNNNISNNKVYGSSSSSGVRRARIPFLLTQKKNKKSMVASSSSSSGENHHVVLKRSKSTATPRSGRYLTSSDSNDFSPRRRGFWSFLHLSHKKPTAAKELKPSPQPPELSASLATSSEPPPPQQQVVVVVKDGDSSPNSSASGSNATSFGRKVSRSRSVGCGSRSFSGDFFERISTGFGDCTLRRVESHREGRRSTSAARAVPCGGLFGGFIITSSSSSSSWVSSAEDANNWPGPRRAATPGPGPMRNRNWAWAFASPRRAFAKTTGTTTAMNKDGRREIVVSAAQNSGSTNATAAPNLAAIPSLLAVRGCAIAGE